MQSAVPRAGFETEVNAGGEPISHRFTILDYEVASLVRRFETVWSMREEVPDVEQALDKIVTRIAHSCDIFIQGCAGHMTAAGPVALSGRLRV